ncbi:MAG: transposase [Chloroflexi bacterium]|nr:transposase [Chloroflexota bacterium]
MADFDYTGRHAYHLVVVTSAREPVLVGDLAAQTVADLERAAGATQFELLAYVVMPDHVHVLALGVSDEALATGFVQRFKQFSGYRFKQRAGRQLWQWSFFDHTLRREEDLLAVARYVVGNPVRAGLTRLEDEWPHQGGVLIGGAEAGTNARQPSGAEAPSLQPPPTPRTPTKVTHHD